MKKAKIKVAVHNGEFHPDDAICVVMLADKFGFGNLEIIRTRDAEVLDKCDFVLDVGETCALTKVNFLYNVRESPRLIVLEGIRSMTSIATDSSVAIVGPAKRDEVPFLCKNI